MKIQLTLTANFHEAKTHLSRLVEQAAKGQDFVIAKAGKPMVRVLPLEVPPVFRTFGFLAGQGVVEVNVKEAFAADIDAMFGASSCDGRLRRVVSSKKWKEPK